MGASIINASGSTIPNLVVNEIKEVKVTRSIIFDVPASDQDIVQTMGNKNRRYTIGGWAVVTGSINPLSTARDDLQYLIGRTGSISSDIMTKLQVFFFDLGIDDKGGRPFEFKFALEAVEVI